MNTLIERAKQALKNEANRLFDEKISDQLRDFMAGREDAGWEALVRAVLVSVREPTEAMLSAGLSGCEPSAYTVGRRLARRDQWRLMIDTALNDPDSGDPA